MAQAVNVNFKLDADVKFTLKAIWHTCGAVFPPSMRVRVWSMNWTRIGVNEKNMV